MEEKKFNYIHMITAIFITAILVYVFLPKTNIINNDHNDDLSDLYTEIEELKDSISQLHDKVQNIEDNTSDIYAYIDDMYYKMYPDEQKHSLIIDD